MSELIAALLEMRNRLEANISQNETHETLIWQFRSPSIKVIKIAKKFFELFSSHTISFEVEIGALPLGIDEFLRDSTHLPDDELLLLKLSFNKKQKLNLTDNTFVFFDMSSFYDFFDIKTGQDKLNDIIKLDKQVFIHLPIKQSYSNDYVHLYSIEGTIFQAGSLSDAAYMEQQRILKLHDEYSRGNHRLIPEYYVFETQESELQEWADRNLFNLCLSFLANKMTSEDKVLIRGHKNCEISLLGKTKVENANVLYKIYAFSHDEKQSIDKIEISRNVLTLYLNTEDNAERLVDLIPKIFQTINSHFSAYIQNSIKHFFNDRRELIKEAQKYASELRADSEKLLNFINASMIGIITAIFSS